MDGSLDAAIDVPTDTPRDAAMDAPLDALPDVLSCPAGQHVCAGACVASASTATCGVNCSPCPLHANASATCDGVQCGFACASGFGDCDGNPATGCETSVTDDVMHCGDCATRCVYPHAAGTCTAGRCVFGPCAPGYADCNAAPADGCEAPLDTPAACGRCGVVCTGATPLCLPDGAGGYACVAACTPGATAACYDGPAATLNRGPCRGGTHTCQPDGTWGPCTGEVLPAAEVCADCVDQDCDGVLDNGCDACIPAATSSCYTGPAGTNGVGLCHGGSWTCQCTDAWGSCVGQVTPAAEVCDNGIDEDCDGVADNGCPVPNDTIATATALAAARSQTLIGRTTGARNDITLSCGVTSTSPDVFYRLDVLRREVVYADTMGSSFDTVIALVTAAGVEATTVNGAACNDDGPCASTPGASQLIAVLEPGTYYLAVSGQLARSGPFVLHVQRLPGGSVANRPMPPGSSVLNGSIGGPGNTSPTCATTSGLAGEDAWYFARCPTSGAVSYHAYASQYCGGTYFAGMMSYFRSALTSADTCQVFANCAAGSSETRYIVNGTYTVPAGSGELFVLYVDSSTTFGGGTYAVVSSFP
jgi:hypothetical protein